MPDASVTLLSPVLADATAYVLVSWWKPIILALPLLVWAWYVSTVLDKHAARFNLPRKRWNAVHLSVGTVAVGISFVLPVFLPLSGIVSTLVVFALASMVLGVDAGVFTMLHNKDERVGEDNKVKIDFSELAAKREAAKAKKQQGTVSMHITRADKTTLDAPDKETPEFDLRVKAEELYGQAMSVRSSRLDIEPVGGSGENTTFGAFAHIDGVRTPIEQLSAQSAVRLIDFWKSAGLQDLGDRRKKQISHIFVGVGDVSKQVRVTTQGGKAGPMLSLLIEPQIQVRREFEDLGLVEAQQELIRGWSLERGGIVLVSLPPDNGLTTTMYATLRLHDAYTNVVQSIELDIRDTVEGVRQGEFDPLAEGPSHANTVRSVLRRDPDIVAVTELLSPETAQEILNSDLERSRVYVGLRADNAIMAIRQFQKAAGDPEKVAKHLKGVISGKLARKLCENCRVAYPPTPDLIKKLGLPQGRVKQLFKKSGQVIPQNKNQPETCPVCRGTGYLGRVGIYETYPINDEARAAIEKENWDALRTELRKHKELPPFQTSAVRTVVSGQTSVEELARITAPPAKPQKKPAAKAPANA